MWKFQNFTAIYILHEIILKPLADQRLPFLSFQRQWILVFGQILAVLKCKKTPNSKFSAPKMSNWQSLEFLGAQSLISRKIWVAEYFWNFRSTGENDLIGRDKWYFFLHSWAKSSLLLSSKRLISILFFHWNCGLITQCGKTRNSLSHSVAK